MNIARRVANIALGAAPLLGIAFVVGCGASPDDGATAAATPPGAPASVAPEGFIATPHGYFHPSCVIEVADGEQQDQDGNLVGADGKVRTLPGCQYPHYDRFGAEMAPEAPRNEPPPEINSWVESASATAAGPIQFIAASWQVPSAPAVHGGQTVYYFPGAEALTNTQTIVQPVLGWTGGSWTIASWNCCMAGNVTHSAAVAVNAGDTIYGYAQGSSCDGNGQCPSWQVYTQDQSTGKSTTLNTSSFGQTFNWSFGGVLEAYGIDHCAQYPASGQVTFEGIVVKRVGGQQVSFNWSNSAPTGGSPQCGYGVGSNPGAVAVYTTPTTMYTPNPPTSCGRLSPGQGLVVGQSLGSCDGRFSLTMQYDGNLVLYEGSTALWATHTNGSTGFAAVQQTDGNFVLYNMSGAPLWADGNSYQHPGSYLAVQNDGNLVVYSGSTALWASNTSGH